MSSNRLVTDQIIVNHSQLNQRMLELFSRTFELCVFFPGCELTLSKRIWQNSLKYEGKQCYERIHVNNQVTWINVDFDFISCQTRLLFWRWLPSNGSQLAAGLLRLAAGMLPFLRGHFQDRTPDRTPSSGRDEPTSPPDHHASVLLKYEVFILNHCCFKTP